MPATRKGVRSISCCARTARRSTSSSASWPMQRSHRCCRPSPSASRGRARRRSCAIFASPSSAEKWRSSPRRAGSPRWRHEFTPSAVPTGSGERLRPLKWQHSGSRTATSKHCMKPDSRIYVAGHRGLAGSALVRGLQARGYRNLVTRTHAELDLIDSRAVREFFQRERPEVVFLAAAKVGGIVANESYPADFIYQNLGVQTNVLQEAWKAGVRDLLFLGTSCIYPRECPQPIREEYLLTGPLEPTNRPYALAKIAGIEMCWSFNRQYGTRYLCAMPNNMYGPGDNYDLQTGHVLPALIRKFHEAKVRREKTVTLWGSGTPRREFVYSDDMADACIHLMNLPEQQIAAAFNPQQPPLFNIGHGRDQTIRELAEVIKRIVESDASIAYDRSKPDGTPQKLLDTSKLSALGWRPRVALEEGLRLAYASFLKEGAGRQTTILPACGSPAPRRS